MVHSPHHRPYTRRCAACDLRRPWRGGAVVEVSGQRLFLCRACAAPLVALRRRQKNERARLAARQAGDLARQAEAILFPVFRREARAPAS